MFIFGEISSKVLLILCFIFVYSSHRDNNTIVSSDRNISKEEIHSKFLYRNSHHHVNILKAVVLSNNLIRFNSSQKCLIGAGFHDIMMFPPIDYLSSVIDEDYKKIMQSSDEPLTPEMRKVISNRLSFVKAMLNFADESSNQTHNNEWRFFFEDDIANQIDKVPSYPAAIFHAMEIAKTDGVMYLGVCAPSAMGDTYEHNYVESVRVFGPCAHAFGLAKWKVKSFLDALDLLTKGPNGLSILYLDVQFIAYGKTRPILLVGYNLSSPYDGDHRGLFWQDRNTFKSEISEDVNVEQLLEQQSFNYFHMYILFILSTVLLVYSICNYIKN